MGRKDHTSLRWGYSTGACAAALAVACWRSLRTGTPPAVVPVLFCDGKERLLPLRPPAPGRMAEMVKDGGDDPDCTHGAVLFARLSACAPEDARPEDHRLDAGAAVLILRAVEGIGRCTRQGLDCPPGKWAVTGGPRRLLAENLARAGMTDGCWLLELGVENGAELARHTLNPRLGVEGGISILGTTGIVEPRSLAALRDSIELEIRQHAAMGRRGVVLTPGNYGEQFISGHFHLNGAPMVFISNFVGDAIDCCVREGFTNVLLVGHIGKLVKVAGGIMDTHSRTADCRAEILAAHAALAGADAKTVREIMSSVTTTAALEAIEAAGVGDAARASLAAATEDRLRRRAAGACDIAAVVFDAERRELFRTSGADAVIGELGATYE